MYSLGVEKCSYLLCTGECSVPHGWKDHSCGRALSSTSSRHTTVCITDPEALCNEHLTQQTRVRIVQIVCPFQQDHTQSV